MDIEGSGSERRPALVWATLIAGASLLAVAVVLVVNVLIRPADAAVARPPLQGTETFSNHALTAGWFALPDQYGRLITRNTMRGRVWAVTFLDSHCVKRCPVEAAELATVQRMLGGARSPMAIVVVSVNPWLDTPASAKAFIRKEHLVGRVLWLMGSPARLAPVWFRYGIEVRRAVDVVHTTVVYLVDRSGRVRVADAVPFLTGQLAASERYLAGQRP